MSDATGKPAEVLESSSEDPIEISSIHLSELKRPTDRILISVYWLQSHNFPPCILKSIYAYGTNFVYKTNYWWAPKNPGGKEIVKIFKTYYQSKSTLYDLSLISGIRKDVPANVMILRKDFDILEDWLKRPVSIR